jgi:hypothetical protein
MSEAQDTKLSMIKDFIEQRDSFVQQSTQLQVQYQQLQGAIFACNQMIAKLENDAKAHLEELAKNIQGESENVEVNKQAEE